MLVAMADVDLPPASDKRLRAASSGTCYGELATVCGGSYNPTLVEQHLAELLQNRRLAVLGTREQGV